MTVVSFNGCSKVDRHLNGAWALDEENPIIKERGGGIGDGVITFENGNFKTMQEYTSSWLKGVYIRQKGTYITNDGNIVITITHLLKTRGAEEEIGKFEEVEQKRTLKYSVSDNKLTLSGDVLFFGNIFRAIDPLELVRVKKYTNAVNDGKEATDSSKKSVSAPKSSGSVSSFPGRWQLIEGRGDAKDVELFKDGTGTADGNGITWKIENGRFHILHPFYTFSAYYNVTGSTITFTKDDGAVVKYQKK
jgi:hypothetical protein